MVSNYIDDTHLRKNFLPKLNQYIWSASFAPNRFWVKRVFVCAAVISQEEAVIRKLLKRMPLFSTTQDGLDWQPDGERRSAGDVYQHLMTMSSSQDYPKPNYLLKEVESSSVDTQCTHSFRLSTLEICNSETPMGYHIGATALSKLPGFESKKQECDLWTKLFFQYLIDMDDESPGIIWGGRQVPTAVVWQVQLDIVDNLNCRRSRPSYELKRRRSTGPMAQVQELPASPEKQHKGAQSPRKYKGVRYRGNRGSSGVWVAEKRLPSAEKITKDKVSFGDYKSEYEAARAIDAVFHYYHKGPYNFPDSPELLQTCPFPPVDGLKGKEKLEAVKKQAKWLATNAPPLSTSQPSLPISTACPLQETVASPGFSRSDSRESDESDESDGITLDHIMIDDFLEPSSVAFQAVDNQCEERTLSSLALPPCFNLSSLPFDEPYEASTPSSIETSMLSTALFPPSSIETSMLSTALFPPSSVETSMLSTALFPPSSIETSMLSTALFPPYDWCNQINGDAYAPQNLYQVSQVSQVSIGTGSRL